MIIIIFILFSKFLYPIPNPPRLSDGTDQTMDSNLYPRFKVVDDQVINNMKHLFDDRSTYPDKCM